MNDDFLEKQIRSLKPAPLPADLRARLSAEPIQPQAGSGRLARLIAVAAAAVALVAAAGMAIVLRPVGSGEVASEPEPPVSIVQQESTLLNSRTLALQEHDGQLWEVSEEEWRDETSALCSTSPIKLQSTVIRREIVCAPVAFQ